jgi:hypothetical protein
MKLNRKNLTFAFAIVALLVGIIIVAIGYNNFVVRSFGLLFVMLSAQLVRISKGQGQGELKYFDQNLTPDVRSGPSRNAKALCLASGIALAISFFLLYNDAANGYKQMWPVYTFAGCAVVFGVLWGYLGAKSVK